MNIRSEIVEVVEESVCGLGRSCCSAMQVNEGWGRGVVVQIYPRNMHSVISYSVAEVLGRKSGGNNLQLFLLASLLASLVESWQGRLQMTAT